MENQKAQSVSFTGHRQIHSDAVLTVTARLDALIAEFIGKRYSRFLAGGAVGFDTLAAGAVLRAREQNNGIKLIIVQPCRDQDVKWNEIEKSEYRRILMAADEVICLSDHYYNGVMAKRNQHLIDNSSVCVAYMTHSRSGAGQTIRMAKEQGLQVINITEGDYENGGF